MQYNDHPIFCLNQKSHHSLFCQSVLSSIITLLCCTLLGSRIVSNVKISISYYQSSVNMLFEKYLVINFI